MALFISKKRELRLIVKPTDRTFDEARRPVMIRGERVEFFNHRYQTGDPDLINWLENHALHGNAFVRADMPVLTKDPIIEEVEARSKAKAPTIPTMIHGQNTTSNRAGSIEDEENVEPTPEPARPFETPITRDEIEIMIDSKMDEFLNKVAIIMQSQAAAKEPTVKQKRVFTCPVPGCGQTFKSGIEVGKHKKLMHAGE